MLITLYINKLKVNSDISHILQRELWTRPSKYANYFSRHDVRSSRNHSAGAGGRTMRGQNAEESPELFLLGSIHRPLPSSSLSLNHGDAHFSYPFPRRYTAIRPAFHRRMQSASSAGMHRRCTPHEPTLR